MPIADERVHLGKALVLQGDTGGATLRKLACQESGVVEIAKAAVAVNKDRQVARVGHALDDIDEFDPGCLVGVAVSERRRDRQTEAQSPLKPACSATAAERPSCASIRNDSSRLEQISLRSVSRRAMQNGDDDDGRSRRRLRLHAELLTVKSCIIPVSDNHQFVLPHQLSQCLILVDGARVERNAHADKQQHDFQTIH